MNKTIVTLLATIALAGAPALARAADVQSFLVAKGQQLQQTNSTTPVLDATNSPHRFFSAVDGSASNSVLGVSLKLPNASTKVFTNEDGGFMFQQAFTNKTMLDAAYGVGTYVFTIQTLLDGTNKPTLTLPADSYPPSPHIANWPDVQAVEASLPFTLYWLPFVGGTTNDFIQLEIEDNHGEFVASSPDLLNPAHLNGTKGSANIPADTLSENTTYNARLLFVKRTSLNTNLPGALGSAGYFRQTQFPITTLPAAPEGGRVQFGAGGFLVPENIGDSHEVTVTRTGSEAAFDVQLGMVDATATSGLDYINTPSTTVHFAEGEHTVQVSVPILEDYLLEGNEYIGLALAAPSIGTLGPRSNALFTILDNEVASAGKIQFTARGFNFAEAAGTAKVTLTRYGGSGGAVRATFHTVAGSATDDVDFIHTNGTVHFANGQTTGTIVVPLIGDALDETNEIFWVILDSTAGGAAFGTNLNATINIIDDDTGGTVAFKSVTYTTNENNPGAVITVARTGGAAGNVTVDFATANGTATAGLDYFPTNGTLTFGSNELTKTFTVGVINDFVVETNETVLLSLSNATGGSRIGAFTNATLRIVDEESSFSFTNASYAIGEAGRSISINVLRTGSLITTSAVTLATANVTAVSTNDYRGTNITFVFPINTKLKTIVIPIINDTFVESNETFTLALSNPLNGAQLGSIPVTTVTITNNDFGGVVFFSTNSYSVNENATNAVLTLNRTNGLASAVSVDVTASDGSAVSGIDYSNTTQTVTFAAGETSKKVFLPIINDTIDETNETLTVALSNPQGGGSLGARTNATLTITDNDSGGVIAFKSATFATNENSSPLLVTVVRTNGIASEVTVHFTTQNISAEDGDDYGFTNGTLTFAAGETSKTIPVPIHDDTFPEGNETFAMLLSNPTGGATLSVISNATLIIRDDESSVAFSNVTYVVSEAGTNVTLTVVRSGALITPVTVQFSTLDDSAISTNDYRGTNGTLNFATNVSSLAIKIPIVNDTIVEPSESFAVFLHTPTGGLQLGTQTNVTITITDNDLGGVIFFPTNSYSVNENGTNATITLSRTNGLASGVTVKFNTDDGSADHDNDYSDATQTATFAAGETSKKVLVPIINDTLDETNETVFLALDNTQGGASLGSRINAELTIVDNDTAGVISFKSAAQSTNENATNFVVTVIRTGGLASGVTVDYRTQDGTAEHDSDYTETHATLAFGAGETNKTFPVLITNDSIAEGDEPLSVFLSAPTGSATLGAISNATLTIVDDESSLSFSNAAYVISEAGPAITVSVLRSGALVTPVSVQFATTNGSAISTNDYRGTNGTLNFAVGVAARTITIPIINDTLAEPDETFELQLFNPQGGTQLGAITNTTLTITNNDFGGAIRFSSPSFTGYEGSNAIVTIARTGGLASGVTVDFAIGGGSAIKGTDYTDASGTITFNAGESNKTVSIPIISDGTAETTETASLTLSNATGGATLGSPATVTLHLHDLPATNAVLLTGTPFLTLTMLGTNGFTNFNRSINITNTGNQITNSGTVYSSAFTNVSTGLSNTVLTGRAERRVPNTRAGTTRITTDQFQLLNFFVPGTGVRSPSQSLPGAVQYLFADNEASVPYANYLFEWESGTVNIDGVEYGPAGEITALSGRVNLICRNISPGGSSQRIVMVGKFRFHQ